MPAAPTALIGPRAELAWPAAEHRRRVFLIAFLESKGRKSGVQHQQEGKHV